MIALKRVKTDTDIDYMNRGLKGNFKQAERLNTKYIIIIGSDEVNNRTLTIKDNNTKEEFKIKDEELINFFDEHIEEEE
jgi:histidyl-tRNA synthetase